MSLLLITFILYWTLRASVVLFSFRQTRWRHQAIVGYSVWYMRIGKDGYYVVSLGPHLSSVERRLRIKQLRRSSVTQVIWYYIGTISILREPSWSHTDQFCSFQVEWQQTIVPGVTEPAGFTYQGPTFRSVTCSVLNIVLVFKINLPIISIKNWIGIACYIWIMQISWGKKK